MRSYNHNAFFQILNVWQTMWALATTTKTKRTKTKALIFTQVDIEQLILLAIVSPNAYEEVPQHTGISDSNVKETDIGYLSRTVKLTIINIV